MGIDLDAADKMEKKNWKKMIKAKIEKELNQEAERKEEGARKTRHQKGQIFEKNIPE